MLDITTCNHDRFDASFMPQFGDVIHIFIKYNRLGISVGDSRDFTINANINRFVRGQVNVICLFGSVLRDVPVLAEFTIDIAPGGGN